MGIQYVPYRYIDKQKWDDCIRTAENGLIYACSFYLDAMANHWDALVLNDYEAVMPLTWNKKFGVYYLYQPFFTAALGLFGNDLSPVSLENFLKQIPAKFRFWDIYLNYKNLFQLQDFRLYERMNYVLPLNKPYETLHVAFRDNIKRNIKKSEKLGCIIKKNFNADEVIKLSMQHAQQFADIPELHYDRFRNLYQLLHSQQKAVTYGVYASSGELLASSIFFFFKKRAHYILVGNHHNSKAYGASHALINAFIKDHAGKELLLDFEGSDINSLAFFYSSFGAQEEKYAGLKYNRLPWLLRFFKK